MVLFFFGRVVTISACAQSHPASIALRYVQRRILMSDPNWNKGFYYNGSYPRLGMKHARLVVVLCEFHVNYICRLMEKHPKRQGKPNGAVLTVPAGTLQMACKTVRILERVDCAKTI